MAEISYILGCERTHSHAVALVGGNAFRIKAPLLKKEFKSGKALWHLLLRFTRALIMQKGHIAAGARDHTIVQQLCHFLIVSCPIQRGRLLSGYCRAG